jgi:hypothetical protein
MKAFILIVFLSVFASAQSAPTDGQTLVWSTSRQLWIPTTTTASPTFTGTITFPNGAGVSSAGYITSPYFYGATWYALGNINVLDAATWYAPEWGRGGTASTSVSIRGKSNSLSTVNAAALIGGAGGSFDLGGSAWVIGGEGSAQNTANLGNGGYAYIIGGKGNTGGYNGAVVLGNLNTSMVASEVNFISPQPYYYSTITAAGTTGARTINKPAGSVNFAANATSLVVTNSYVTASSNVICTVQTNDSTLKSVQCVPGSGSFTMYANAAATAETRVGFMVVNAPSFEPVPFVALGDSKTANNTQYNWVRHLDNKYNSPGLYLAAPVLATSGWTSTQLKNAIDAYLTTYSSVVTPTWVLINIGANGWVEADVQYTLDAVHTAWPNAQVRLTGVWKNAGVQVSSAQISSACAGRTSWCAMGADEAVYLQGSDNGASETYDGQHYSAFGAKQAAAAWRTALGY